MRQHNRTAISLIGIGMILVCARADASCSTRWYEGAWQCTLGNSPMRLNFDYGGEECQIQARASIANGPDVTMHLIAADDYNVSFEDDAGNVFRMRHETDRWVAKGQATIDGMADPLACNKRPLRSPEWRRYKLRSRHSGDSP